ncbi:hypothetical protein HPG69_014401, partial [Diceros bicornis minor]
IITPSQAEVEAVTKSRKIHPQEEALEVIDILPSLVIARSGAAYSPGINCLSPLGSQRIKKLISSTVLDGDTQTGHHLEDCHVGKSPSGNRKGALSSLLEFRVHQRKKCIENPEIVIQAGMFKGYVYIVQ